MDSVLESVTSQKMQTLATTYRARPELVQIFNDLFIPAFVRELGLKEQEIELRPNRVFNPALPVPLEFWDLHSGQINGNGKPKRLTNVQAAHALAEAIAQLLANSVQVEDRDSSQLRPLQLRDIAVLCRTNEGVTTVAEALRARGLPLTFGTSGLLSTPETRLAMACLRRLADPGDTLATAEIIALEAEYTPEQWLEDRLSYLSTHLDDLTGRRWGLEGPLINRTVTALQETHPRLDQLTPTEALDVALGAGNVFATVSKWGPSETQSAQRRANLEALRGLAQQYENSCAPTHSPITAAGIQTGDALDRMYGEALSTALAVHLLREYGAAVLGSKSQYGRLPREKLMRAVEYIQDQLDTDLTVSGIAQAVYMTPYHFTRLSNPGNS